jgi:hypothetical protein
MWSGGWNENWQGKPKHCEKTFPNAILSTKDSTWDRTGTAGMESLSYGAAMSLSFQSIQVHESSHY